MESRKLHRILYHHRTRGDGAEGVHINEMIEAFRELGHTVQVCCPPSARRQPGLAMGMTGLTQEQSKGLVGWGRIAFRQSLEIAYNAISFARLNRAIRRFNPTVVYERYSCYHSAGARATARCKLPFLLEVNSTYTGRFQRRQLAFPKLAASIERFVLGRANVIATVSRPLMECVQDRKIPSERIVVTPNAINERVVRNLNFEPRVTRERLGIPVDAIVVGFVGSLRRWHGVDMLIQSIPKVMERTGHVVLLIVGSGELESELKSLHRNPSLVNRVLLTGGVPHSQVYELISCMDIGLMPHSNQWGSPMKILEYMALGKLCIAPRIAPIEEIVQDGLTGMLFAERDESALTEAIVWACENADSRIDMGQAGRTHVLNCRRWIDNANTVLAAYESIADRLDPTRMKR